MASRFGQFADPSAPPADLFNIWRDDYMLSPQQAASEAAERAKNTLFDGVLPPFSNVGNTDRDLGMNIVIFHDVPFLPIPGGEHFGVSFAVFLVEF